MKIIVTGGAGYIGSHTIIEIFQHTDWEVVSIDDYSTSTAETYARIEAITGKKVLFHEVDIKNYEALLKVVQSYNDVKGIIHFAAHKWVGDSVENPIKYYKNNVGGLMNVLKVQTACDIPYFIFSSSCSVYGNITALPVTEKSAINKAESPYAYTKQIGERIIADYTHAKKGKQAISLRYFNPVGAHQSGLNGEIQPQPNNLVPFVTQTAIGKIKKLSVYGNDYATKDGTCVRDYIHVSDIAIAHVQALSYLLSQKSTLHHDVINLGSGVGVSVLEIIKAFEKVSGKTLNYEIGEKREGDVAAIYANCNKANKILGWTPQYSLENMMLSAWKWEQYISL